MKKFVLSSSGFDSIKDAESKVNMWWENGKLSKKEVKLYKVERVYDLKLKFVERRRK